MGSHSCQKSRWRRAEDSKIAGEEGDGRQLALSATERERERARGREERLLSHLGLSFSFCCGTFWRLTAQPMTAGFSDHPVVPGPRDRRFAFRRDSHLYFWRIIIIVIMAIISVIVSVIAVIILYDEVPWYSEPCPLLKLRMAPCFAGIYANTGEPCPQREIREILANMLHSRLFHPLIPPH